MEKREEKKAALCCGAVGVIVYLAIFGIAVLDVTNVDWLMPNGKTVCDLTQHYLGWVNYRNSPWHFPLGLMDNVVYPDLISVIYMDALPLFSFLFKLVSPILPQQFQFFGLFGLLCYFLQGYFAAVIIMRYTKDFWYTVICNFFFVGSNIMVYRMFYHTGLAAQWLILASLAVWIYQERYENTCKWAMVWSVLTVIAMLIQMYLVPMVWGIMICSLIEYVLKTKKIKTVLISVISVAGSFVLTGWVFGLFYGEVSAISAGIGVYSFNLNGFWNTIVPGWHSFLKPSELISQFQYEGYAYLGMGIFVLLILDGLVLAGRCVMKRIGLSEWVRIHKSRLIAVCVMLTGFTVFALSPYISYGTKMIIVPVWQKILHLWGIFRATGRMIWPVWYFIVFMSLILWYKNLKEKKFVMYSILGMLLIVQIVDFMPLYKEKYQVTHSLKQGEAYTLLSSGAWSEIADKYEHIIFYPDTEKYIYGTFEGNLFTTEMLAYVINNNMTSNIAFLSRNISEHVDKETLAVFESYKADHQWDEKTIVVCCDQFPEYSLGLYSYWIDGAIVYLPDKLSREYEGCIYVENAYEYYKNLNRNADEE